MLRKLIDCKTYFSRERYYLLEKKLDVWNGIIQTSIAIPGATIHVVSKPEDVEYFCAEGYDLHSCPNLDYLKCALTKRALVIFVFIEMGFAHYSLITVDDNVTMIDPLYKDMRNKDAGYIGPCYTNPLYRGKGVYPFVLSKACRLLKDMRKTTAFINTKKTNEASLKGIWKAGFEPVCEVDLRKILFWKEYKKVSA